MRKWYFKNWWKNKNIKNYTFHIPQHLQTLSKDYSKVAVSIATLLAYACNLANTKSGGIYTGL